MFATLLGSLPRPPLPPDARPEELLVAVVRAQEAAGLEPVTDGGFGIGDSAVERWRATAALTDRPVKQALLGPFSAGQAAARAGGGHEDADPMAPPDAGAWTEAALAAAETLRADLLALAAAGCPFIEIHEPEAIEIGTDEGRRSLFRDAHRRLLDGVAGAHLSLAITGGNADAAGPDTLLAAPYASLAVDLIAGPENWQLVVATPGERGIVCGALSAERDSDDRPEVLIWAAGYASSTGGRGSSRVGLASASSLAGLPWEVALRKLAILGEAARLADLPARERRLQLDPRAVDIRSAALGRYEPRPTRPRRQRP
ncbi:MAG: hypothetical protein Q7S35_11275 [Candidatus Limnocylindrales bacterium]|nr:hypothetical protein [Candidatus Limnocylindrales bacterium]